MSFSTAGSGVLRAEINITPMIDILLVLMIVFMVAVTMSRGKGAARRRFRSRQTVRKAIRRRRTIVIQLNWTAEDQTPSLKINEESVKWEDLHDRLFDIFKQRAERIAFVKGDDDVDFQYVADAISIARDSGVERVGLLTKTGPETP